MKTRIYVAAASSEIDRAERVISALRESPHIEITEDWCAVMRANPPAAQCSRELLEAACTANVRGVSSAHVVLVLSGDASQGRSGELALATELPTCAVYCSGDWRALGIFGARIDPARIFFSRDESSWESDQLRAERVRRDDDHAIHCLRGLALGRSQRDTPWLPASGETRRRAYLDLVDALAAREGCVRGWQRRVAAKLMISTSTLSNILRRGAPVGDEIAARATSALSLPRDYFAGRVPVDVALAAPEAT